jgi:hypothetical protein
MSCLPLTKSPARAFREMTRAYDVCVNYVTDDEIPARVKNCRVMREMIDLQWDLIHFLCNKPTKVVVR